MNFGCCFATKFLYVAIIVALLSFGACYGLIPKLCAEQARQRNPECCPSVQGFGQPCGGPYRGECKNTEPVVVKQPYQDERQWWPSNVFTRLCVCRPRFDGVGCEHCAIGWTGDGCNIRTNYIRRNIATYSPHEVEIFLNVVRLSDQIESDYVIFKESAKPWIEYDGEQPLDRPALKAASIHEVLVFIHSYVSPPRCQTSGTVDFAHNGESFMLWHRAFMLFWEKQLRTIAQRYFGVQDFTLPYWDWTDQKECTICQDWLIGGQGEWADNGHRLSANSVFRNWKEYCSTYQARDKCVVCHDETSPIPFITRDWSVHKFPTSQDVAYALSMPRYDHPEDSRNTPCVSFHTALEGTCSQTPTNDPGKMHNFVHNIVNGTFRSTYTSPNDPIFIFHHTQIDRLLTRWYRQAPRYPTDLPEAPRAVGQCRDCYLVGFIPTHKTTEMYQDSRELGYDYDDFRFGAVL